MDRSLGIRPRLAGCGHFGDLVHNGLKKVLPPFNRTAMGTIHICATSKPPPGSVKGFVLWVSLLFALLSTAVSAAELRVAVASNFSDAAHELGKLFTRHFSHQLSFSGASTGKLYAQIRQGAPYDVFLAADTRRPTLLESQGEAVAGSRFTYAIGRLALWKRDLMEPGPLEHLKSGEFRHLAVANPKTAPYGRAAREVLRFLALWDTLQGKMVFGENIAQTYQYVATGNAELGFIALAQALRDSRMDEDSLWRIPSELHRPLEQQAVLLTRSREKQVARQFLGFIRTDRAARRLITESGYELPD